MRTQADLQPPPVERASYPARVGNRVRVLVDGHEALGAVAAALVRAQRSIWITVSFVDLDVVLPGTDKPLLELLDAAARRGVDVRLLFWWSEFPGIGSFRGEPAELAELAERGIRIKMRWDDVPRGCHHQKSHVIDGELAYVGGINLTCDGLSTPAHDARGHHDLLVDIVGPAVGDVTENFVQRWNQATRFAGHHHAYPSPAEADDVCELELPPSLGNTTVQIVRTIRHDLYRGTRGWIPEHAFDLAKGESSIHETVHRWIDAAASSIYIENQYLMAPDTLERLRAAAERGVDVITVVPFVPDPNLALYPKARLAETRAALERLARERRFGMFGLRHPGESGKPIYVHAKLLIVDDSVMTIGSANFWPPSYSRDSELNVCIWHPELARATRTRLWAEHIGGASVATLGEWLAIADARSDGARIVRLDPATYYDFPADFVAPWSHVKPAD